ncbi:MAG: thrombospondin type 3 repeat-containing protein [Dehalococcoidia bacterium]|nr:thrombospondin type 3 repeat-containing protein [Dehalococcoidia bacterium]
MRKLFSSHRRFIGLGLMSAIFVALAVVGALWGFSQNTSAGGAAVPPVTLVHVEPSGVDYTGNPYCPDADWTGTLKPVVHPWHDCNNITSQNHVIRTANWLASYPISATYPKWNVEKFTGAETTIIAQGRCGDLAEVIGRAGFNAGQCTNTKDDDGDGAVNDGCPGQVAETGTMCANATDDEDNDPTTAGIQYDGVVNDGCPAVVAAETICTGAVDDDGDTKVNDGCPGQVAETIGTVNQCDDATDDEDNDPTTPLIQLDGVVNDGCPDVDASEDPNDQQCLVIHSSTPGETRVTLTYDDGQGHIITSLSVVKEWDSLVDSVILKSGDLDKDIKVYYDKNGNTIIESSEYVKMDLPKDMNGDGKRDQLDEHELDKQSVWQDHPVVWDESAKRIKALPLVQIIEVVHGEHQVQVNNVTRTYHQPTQGSIVTATIDSPRNCTFFTNAAGTNNSGPTTIVATSDNLGRVIVYVDTVCEEQARIKFHDDYPPGVGSQRDTVDEWVGINWTTIEQAKQPQIRWAGEEIILAKRWALPDDWYPNANCGTADNQVCPSCPLASNFDVDGDGSTSWALDDLQALGHILDTNGDTYYDTILDYSVDYQRVPNSVGALEAQYTDDNYDGVLDTPETDEDDEGEIDMNCISKGVHVSQDPGEGDVVAILLEERITCVGDGDAQAAVFVERNGTVQCYDGESGYQGRLEYSTEIKNKHAFLVWYLKIYQVKLTNVKGERELHNDGNWNQGESDDTEAETLNVSQDALLRVNVKGWLFTADKSGRGAVCIDMDGDGDGGIDNDADTKVAEEKADGKDNDADTKIDEDLEAGVPYPIPSYEAGCPDAGDEMLDNGHWVLPDDLEKLAGADAIHTRPNWDVMSEKDASVTIAIGPKSALDSHDPVGTLITRTWVGRKSIVPDGKITAADAIMPPLKIRASIAHDTDDTDAVEDGESGFLKEALKGVIYPSTNDYHKIMIPADHEIPAVVNNGGYDWMSWTMPACIDADVDGTCDNVDNCGKPGTALVKNPDQSDVDGDGTGDLCDADADGDTILDDGDADGAYNHTCVGTDTTLCDDNCRFKSNATQADADNDGIGDACDTAAGMDTDGDTVVDALDNCPTRSNADVEGDYQKDSDKDDIGDACDPNPVWDYRVPEPTAYPFWTILYKLERQDAKEKDNPSLKRRPWYIEFYTDNRGEGMFFANGDFDLTYKECGTDLVSGAPDCRKGDVVGSSKITVIGDYPYWRKQASILSNPVTKTWEWGGFKKVDAIKIDANHTAIIAHLWDRDGYCKYSVGSNPTVASAVQFSPSLHPVQGEEITFILNSAAGAIVGVSPSALYALTKDQPACPVNLAHCPLYKANVVAPLKDGVISSLSQAVAVAEDGRVLDYYDEARGIDEGLVATEDCQAWIVIEHPLGVVPDVSIFLHDPEGDITRHWPRADVTVPLVLNWNDSCYVGEEAPIEEAMADIIDNVAAGYRFVADGQKWEQYFPDRCEEVADLCTFDTLKPYDQLFILMKDPAEWIVGPIAAGAPADNKDSQVFLAGASGSEPGAWNSVCYAGIDKPTEEAVSDIESGLAIMYQLGSDQGWRYYVPGRPEIEDTLTTLHQYSSVVMLVTTKDGITWKFDP